MTVRKQCHKSKYERRTIKVSQRFNRQRKQSLANISTSKGILLRMNRSIQVEEAFGMIKEDKGFRRFLVRGKRETETQFFCFHLRLIYRNILIENKEIGWDKSCLKRK